MSNYVKIMEQYKIARRAGRKEDANALLKKAREMVRNGEPSEDEITAGAYI